MSRKNPESACPLRSRKSATTTVKSRISATVTTHSQAISAGVPRDMLLSKR